MDSIPQFLPKPPRVHKEAFMAIAWVGVALSGLLFGARIYGRIRSYHRIYVGDFLVFGAWLMFLTNTIIWQVYVDDMYENLYVSAGLLYPLPPNFAAHTERYLRATVAVIIFFYSGLWFIKFSFLAFFKRLGFQVKGQNHLWWIVFLITLASWFASFGTIEYDCLTGSFEYISIKCTATAAVSFQRRTLTYNMVMDVLTDALISMLWQVRMGIKQKLALLGIFCLTVIIMIFAIVRVAMVKSWSFMPDETWLYMWSSIEQTVSIMIACLASFRTLFVKQEPTRKPQASIYYPSRPSKFNQSGKMGLFRSYGMRTWQSTNDTTNITGLDDGGEDTSLRRTLNGVHDNTVNGGIGSQEHIVPLQGIVVRKEFKTVSGQQDSHPEVYLRSNETS
ncbi:hypothetical protein G7Y89_g11572 [Cudoniella acicularis]|uniref:Rhodopsin domain-containing protein n=1 Tax=Cudoniella acicularis TaxID=354080 RepID=A0A8H4RAM1_9HELO|nr:hypothetical protein G7Y89_g11572 [Cudoniella acicularis]